MDKEVRHGKQKTYAPRARVYLSTCYKISDVIDAALPSHLEENLHLLILFRVFIERLILLAYRLTATDLSIRYLSPTHASDQA